jgi:uncharacterized protein YbjQ (UPF0145 family)
MKICPNCDAENPDDAVACSGCGMGLSRVPIVWARDIRKEDIIERAKSLILTTGFEVQGRPIAEYLGIITSEVVMGTGPIVEFLGGLSDLFGRRSAGFEQKLEQAKDISLEKLRGKAAMLGADAIIGVDIDYMEIAANMLMVVANGTAVRLSEP